jgi:hypothetical protein
MRFKKLPPLDYLKEILDYNKETGIFTWKKKLSSKQYVGAEAGSMDNKGYRVIAYYMATGIDPGRHQIDHINRDKNDNRYQNLRLCDNSINAHNRGLTGVHFHKATQKWTAVFSFRKVKHYLGLFDTKQEAEEAYKSKKMEYIPA